MERTNEPYAIAKIAGLKLVEAANAQYGHSWLSLMPTNLYGLGDNFDLTSSHVLPAFIRKFHDARVTASDGSMKPVRLWGTGEPLREFLHVDDVAEAACQLLDSGASGLYNIGSGDEVSIRHLAELISGVAGYGGPIEWDRSKPDGTPRKLLDSSRALATGWRPRISLEEGLHRTYEWYVANGLTVARQA